VSPEGLVTSIGYAINGSVVYVYEGNIHCTGGTIKWLQDDLELIASDSEAEIIARRVPAAEGVYLVPAFAGLGAPYWNNEARAIICGLTRGSKKAHVVRAALEAIAYQVKDLVDLMTEISGIKLKELRVDGGPVKNNLLMQFQADMLQSDINRCEIPEASALGAALVAGLSTGVWKNMDELISLRSGGDIIKCAMAREKADELYNGWKRAVQRSF
jgi:glycerol kinase